IQSSPQRSRACANACSRESATSVRPSPREYQNVTVQPVTCDIAAPPLRLVARQSLQPLFDQRLPLTRFVKALARAVAPIALALLRERSEHACDSALLHARRLALLDRAQSRLADPVQALDSARRAAAIDQLVDVNAHRVERDEAVRPVLRD